MLRGIGMSVLLSWICLNAFGQLPHPNDTLENGKKVPFNQFLGRFSVFNDLGGAAYFYSLNVGYSIIKTDLGSVDLTAGANRIQYGHSWDRGLINGFFVPVGISGYVGRRASQFNLRIGYSPQILSKPLSSEPVGECEGCTTVDQRFFFSIGYTYQNPYGFFLGINANLLLNIWSPAEQAFYPGKIGYQPWPGLVLGYRLPSRQRHREWRERGIKGRVLRMETKTEEKYDEVDRVFYNDEPLHVDSIEMAEIEARLAKLRKRHLRYQLQEQRENGRSHVFVEGFGAAGFWSVNYSYTFPFAKTDLVALDFRGGVGADDIHLQIPIHAGVKIMKNYRGTGVYLGVQPTIDWKRGTAGAIYFLEHNVEFHFAYGLTGGVSFYLFYDPSHFKHRSDFSPYGGFFLGYRLPSLKKNP
ncbi:MAG: hypothetical protein KDB98_00125 [Flavobacteriales bacterium]|nr:hypothetical protein [Flavobacteriales bacterium]